VRLSSGNTAQTVCVCEPGNPGRIPTPGIGKPQALAIKWLFLRFIIRVHLGRRRWGNVGGTATLALYFLPWPATAKCSRNTFGALNYGVLPLLIAGGEAGLGPGIQLLLIE